MNTAARMTPSVKQEFPLSPLRVTIKPWGHGDVTKTHVLWREERALPDVRFIPASEFTAMGIAPEPQFPRTGISVGQVGGKSQETSVDQSITTPRHLNMAAVQGGDG